MQQYEELTPDQVLAWYNELRKRVGPGQARKLIRSILYSSGKNPQQVEDLLSLIPLR